MGLDLTESQKNIIGMFWLPNQEDRKFRGELRLKAGKSAILDTACFEGDFSPDRILNPPPHENGKPVQLTGDEFYKAMFPRSLKFIHGRRAPMLVECLRSSLVRKMKIHFNHCLSVVCLLTVAISVLSCRSSEQEKLAEKHALSLHQSLLRDAIPGIARIWNTSIDLSPEVATTQDLWVDYAPQQEVALHTALDEILRFIDQQHGVALRWRVREGRVTIERSSEQSDGKKPPHAFDGLHAVASPMMLTTKP